MSGTLLLTLFRYTIHTLSGIRTRSTQVFISYFITWAAALATAYTSKRKKITDEFKQILVIADVYILTNEYFLASPVGILTSFLRI